MDPNGVRQRSPGTGALECLPLKGLDIHLHRRDGPLRPARELCGLGRRTERAAVHDTSQVTADGVPRSVRPMCALSAIDAPDGKKFAVSQSQTVSDGTENI